MVAVAAERHARYLRWGFMARSGDTRHNVRFVRPRNISCKRAVPDKWLLAGNLLICAFTEFFSRTRTRASSSTMQVGLNEDKPRRAWRRSRLPRGNGI